MARTGKTAYVFPGQGAQRVGMGQDLYERYASARDVFDEADAALGFPLSRICFSGPEEELIRTDNMQPALLATSIACLRAAQEGAREAIPPAAFVAGHSLGEYTALVATGALDLPDALRLVRKRGELMLRAGEIRPGGMLALIGLDRTAAEEIARETGTEISNVNSPGQIVISGPLNALNTAATLAREKGARRAVALKVSGAFHSPLMEPVLEEFEQVVASTPFRSPSVPVIANVTGQPLDGVQQIPQELVHQLRRCIQWQSCVEYMAQNGTTSFYEFGPGTVLTGLIKRIVPSVETFSISGRDDLLQLMTATAG
ncbi:MAG: ACP S-malonyltransferase [Chloroflexota bacterium]